MSNVRSDKLEYLAGENGTIEGMIVMRVADTFLVKHVVVKTGYSSKIQLTVEVQAERPWEIEPTNLNWVVGAKPEPKRVTLSVKDPSKVKLVSANPSQAGVSATWQEKSPGSYEIDVSVNNTSKTLIGLISLELDSPFPRFKKEMVFIKVHPATYLPKDGNPQLQLKRPANPNQ